MSMNRKSFGRDAVEFEDVVARVLDIVLIALGATLASFTVTTEIGHPPIEGAFVGFGVGLGVLTFPCFGLYKSWRGRSKWRLAVTVAFAWLLVQAFGLGLMFALHKTAHVSRLWFGMWTLLTCFGLIAWRLIAHAALGYVRRNGKDLRTVAVVGAGQHFDSVLSRIESETASGFRAIGMLNTQETLHSDEAGMRKFVAVEPFVKWVREKEVDEVWLALSMSEESFALKLVAQFSSDLVNLRFIPDVRSLMMFDGDVVELFGAPAINLMASPMSSSAMLKKAIFDRLFAAIALLAMSPVLAAVAVAVKLSSNGPVLFTQKRRGADGKVFRIYKFRSMRAHTAKVGIVEQATRGDPRITRVGAFLRRTSLDELPQFLNVLRGEMSVVGPRPHAIEHDNHYQEIVDGYIHRYRIKPGITGWAQVNGFRGEADRIEKMQGRVECDLYYLRNWSFRLDMRIVIATVMKGFFHRNAY
ncbi:undecaprenyl-phosphate glucose phosphotransferase [Paraburkholderia sp.]|uniref:undecaprenyl-phosphate glucose phosphotransferase n=1 Tax=Paraburkholderia sp. TaxID=1926495 RepID=UPI00238A967B|nr:undecaprenyl-phosphate glucose phosphotransferase [Paraburkholderia sp.]MDE1179743.1 undecaprenyl-phosphate glucose phosphotransferase [Paraburkholderia sp.]